MSNTLDTLLVRMRSLEKEIIREIRLKEVEFSYKITNQKVRFTEEAKLHNRQFAKKIHRTIIDSKFLTLLTTPIIWACLVPLALLDLIISMYQFICFPVYGIPKVRRKDYILIDRQQLSYLNQIEKMNCIYCGYANGLLAYTTEVAGRTEQYWCPVKHALKIKTMHSRYSHFFDYGNADDYRKRIKEVRRDFGDIEPHKNETSS